MLRDSTGCCWVFRGMSGRIRDLELVSRKWAVLWGESTEGRGGERRAVGETQGRQRGVEFGEGLEAPLPDGRGSVSVDWIERVDSIRRG